MVTETLSDVQSRGLFHQLVLPKISRKMIVSIGIFKQRNCGCVALNHISFVKNLLQKSKERNGTSSQESWTVL
jgi:hypothetical protein